MARIAFGGFRHETNTFAPVKADLRDYEIGGAYPGLTRGKPLFDAIEGMNLSVFGFVDEARRLGHELVPLLWCFAVPSAHTTKRAYETILGELLDLLRKAGPIDALYLDLHGAMVAEHLEDGEGELYRRVRAVVGPELPIVTALDYHANMTPEMIAHATGIVAYRTYPHVDRGDTGRRAARHLHGLLTGSGATFKAFRQIPFIIPLTCQYTNAEPCKSIFDRLRDLEGGDVATLSFTPGFPLADIHHCGPAVFGYGRSQAAVDRAVNALADEIIAREKEFAGGFVDLEEGVTRALTIARRAKRPVVLADTQDNPGAGGTADTTGVLEFLVRHRAEDAVIGVLYDPETAAQAAAAGEGAVIEARLGGKSGFPGVAPYAARFTVEKIGDGEFTGTGPMFKGVRYKIGPMALLRIDGVRVVVASKRAQAADQSLFRHLGVDPARQKIVALKSSVHFRADFAPLAEEIIVVVAPGPNTADTTKLPFKHLRPGLRLAPLGPAFRPA